MNLTLGIAIAFFLSGFVSLTFQVVWRKVLSQTVGLDFTSSTLIVTIFMLGLAIGAQIGSVCVQKMRRPLLAFIVAEMAVSAFGLISIVAIRWAPTVGEFFGIVGVGAQGYAVDFAINFALLLVPTALMGVSFPIIVHVYRNILVPGAATGILYSANIAGAALGALVSGFVLIGTIGLTQTAILAALLNMGQVVYIAYLYAKKLDAGAPSGPVPEAEAAPAVSTSSRILLCAFGIGFAALAFEIIFIRLMTKYLTANSYTFPIAVAAYLLMMALGNAVAGALLQRGVSAQKIVNWASALTIVLATLTVSFPWLLTHIGGAQLEIMQFSQVRYLRESPSLMLQQAIMFAVVTFAPVAAVSALFPAFVHKITHDPKVLGVNVARVYVVQTIGNVIGVLIGGLFLVPNFGITGSLLACCVLVAAGALAMNRHSDEQDTKIKFAAVAAASAFVAMLLVTPGTLYSNFTYRGAPPDRYKRGLEGTALLYDAPTGTRIHLGSEPAASYGTEATSRLELWDALPVYESVTQNEIRNVLIIGIGTGSLALQIKQKYPAANVVIVELLEVVIDEMRTRASPAMKDLINASEVHVTDGRRYVSRKALPENLKFDFIQVGVFHVTSSGAGGLFTTEFQHDLRSLLTPNGGLSFNAYLPAVKSGFEVFEKGIVVARELGRGVADVVFFNNNDVDIVGGLRRYPVIIDEYRLGRRNTDKLVTTIPEWAFSEKDPRWAFPDKDVIVSALDPVAFQTDDLVATEYFLTQTTTWPHESKTSSTVSLDPRYWDQLPGAVSFDSLR